MVLNEVNKVSGNVYYYEINTKCLFVVIKYFLQSLVIFLKLNFKLQ